MWQQPCTSYHRAQYYPTQTHTRTTAASSARRSRPPRPLSSCTPILSGKLLLRLHALDHGSVSFATFHKEDSSRSLTLTVFQEQNGTTTKVDRQPEVGNPETQKPALRQQIRPVEANNIGHAVAPKLSHDLQILWGHPCFHIPTPLAATESMAEHSLPSNTGPCFGILQGPQKCASPYQCSLCSPWTLREEMNGGCPPRSAISAAKMGWCRSKVVASKPLFESKARSTKWQGGSYSFLKKFLEPTPCPSKHP